MTNFDSQPGSIAFQPQETPKPEIALDKNTRVVIQNMYRGALQLLSQSPSEQPQGLINLTNSFVNNPTFFDTLGAVTYLGQRQQELLEQQSQSISALISSTPKTDFATVNQEDELQNHLKHLQVTTNHLLATSVIKSIIEQNSSQPQD